MRFLDRTLMAIAPFLPGIFFFGAPQLFVAPAPSTDICSVLNGSVRGRGIAFLRRGGGGLGRRSLRYTASAIRLGESTQRSNLSPGGVPDAAASYSSSGEPSEVNMTARRITLRRTAGGVGTRPRLHGALGRTRKRQLFFWPRVYLSSLNGVEDEPRWNGPRAVGRGRPTSGSPARLPPPRTMVEGDGIEEEPPRRFRHGAPPSTAPAGCPPSSCMPSTAVNTPWLWRPFCGRRRRWMDGVKGLPTYGGSQRILCSVCTSANADGTAEIRSLRVTCFDTL